MRRLLGIPAIFAVAIGLALPAPALANSLAASLLAELPTYEGFLLEIARLAGVLLFLTGLYRFRIASTENAPGAVGEGIAMLLSGAALISTVIFMTSVSSSLFGDGVGYLPISETLGGGRAGSFADTEIGRATIGMMKVFGLAYFVMGAHAASKLVKGQYSKGSEATIGTVLTRVIGGAMIFQIEHTSCAIAATFGVQAICLA